MKKWYTSKTLWVNLVSIGAIVAQSLTGNEIMSAEQQAVILGIVNLLLRMVTKEGLN